MTTIDSPRKTDVKPVEFSLAVILGGMGSAILSGLHVNAFISVAFALTIMSTLAFFRWRIARELKDFQSLEAYAEDIYLLGYLLTLAALLGMTPQLMSDDSNLFKIAGIKLSTTVVGLALMMIFRQTARRWAEEKSNEEASYFLLQQQQFSEAVGRLNGGADMLTAKLAEVVGRFTPDLLIPVAEWSNRATAAFKGATSTFEEFPTAFEKTMRCLNDLNSNLNLIRMAAVDVSNVLTSQTVQAASALATELNQAGAATSSFGVTVANLKPSGEAAQLALNNLSKQADFGVTRLAEIGGGLGKTAAELSKVDVALQRIVQINGTDLDTPLNRLVTLLEASVKSSVAAAEKIENIKSELQIIADANKEIVGSFRNEIGKPLNEQLKVLQIVQEKIADAVKINTLATEMAKTNEHMKNLLAKIDAEAGGETKGKFFGWFKGGH
jgi:hypothetical protein